MKAISILGEYWDLIHNGEKTEEYRSWPTKYRGVILLCYTAVGSSPGATSMVADLYDCVPCDDGGYAFKLRNIRYFKPFSVKGQQRIYNIDVTIDDLGRFYDPAVPQDVDEYFKIFQEFADKVNADDEKRKKGA